MAASIASARSVVPAPLGVARRAGVALVTLGTALFAPTTAAAHPHIFVDYRVAVLFDRSGAAALRVTWSFDELYSSTLRSDYTKTPKGPITPEDVQSLREQHFTPVKAKHFFAYATIDGKARPLDAFTDFSARFDADKAVYSFAIPLAAAESASRHTLEFWIFDPEYYVDFELAPDQSPEHAIGIEGGQSLGAHCAVSTVRRDTIGWGKADTDLVTCTYSGSSS